MYFSKSKTFLFTLISFIIGITIRSFFEINTFLIYIILLVSIISLIVFWKRGKISLPLLFILFCCLGIIRYNLALPKNNPGHIHHYNEKESIQFKGVIKEVDQRLDHSKLTIQTEEIEINNGWQPVEGLVLIKSGLYPVYNYGDRLEIGCSLKEPGEIEGFAYDRYLAKSHIYSTCYRPWIEVLSHDAGNLITAKVLGFKEQMHATIKNGLPEPHASVVSAIILGERRGIPQELTDKFSISGISHIVAISGMHITIIAAILMALAINLGFRRGQDFWLVVVSLGFYIFLIGLPPSAMRAGLMALMFLLAMKIGRLNKSVNGLVFAAAIMLVVNPKLLRDDIGFQLSFLAVLSLLYVLPFIESKIEKLPSILKIKEMFIVTISAQALTLPLIVYYFGRMSIIAPAANILILPILPFIMILSFIAIIGGFFSRVLAQFLFMPVWLLVSYLLRVVEYLSSLTWAAFGIENVSGWLIACFYIGVFALILKPWRNLVMNNENNKKQPLST